jgi:hypothetical protein
LAENAVHDAELAEATVRVRRAEASMADAVACRDAARAEALELRTKLAALRAELDALRAGDKAARKAMGRWRRLRAAWRE